MPFVIRRTDQGGGYVARPDSKHSYVHSVHRARKYDTREAAVNDRCPENEVVEDLYVILGMGDKGRT